MLKKIIFSPMLQLGVIDRYSGVYLTKKDTVGDHTCQVGLIGITMGQHLKKLGVEVDIPQIALKSLVHDLDEAMTCDIPRNVKYYSEAIKLILDELAESVVSKMADQVECHELVDYWENSKNNTIEGLIVKMADLITVVRKVVEEIEILGNKYMFKVSLEIENYLCEMLGLLSSPYFRYGEEARDYLSSLMQESSDLIRDINIKYSDDIKNLLMVNHSFKCEATDA